MAPLLCPSPVLLDHSFPRNEAELDEITAALGNLQLVCSEGRASILATPVFPDYVANLDWSSIASHPRLHDIFRYLTVIFLQPNASQIVVDTDRLPDAPEHPLPPDCDDREELHIWGIEVGKVLKLHDSLPGEKPFIGISCHRGFAGGVTSTYAPPQSNCFPLVGLNNFENLADGSFWDTHPNIIQQPVRYRDAERNMHLLDGKISSTAVGSHYKVAFPEAPRPWVLDANIDPLEERYLRELPVLVKKPLGYIKEVLIYGVVPTLKSRLEGFIRQ